MFNPITLYFFALYFFKKQSSPVQCKNILKFNVLMCYHHAHGQIIQGLHQIYYGFVVLESHGEREFNFNKLFTRLLAPLIFHNHCQIYLLIALGKQKLYLYIILYNKIKSRA